MVTTKFVSLLSRKSDGGTLELNKVSYNGGAQQWDIRRFGYDKDCQRCALKGVTLSYEEMKTLKQVLAGIEDL